MNKPELIEALQKKGFPKNILDAFNEVDRSYYVPEDMQDISYEDATIPVAEGQILSQPSTIAFMLELLDVKPGQKVLEIGCGTGYVLSLLTFLTQKGPVFGIEIKEKSVALAKERLANLPNVNIFCKNGLHGLQENSPYDRILISAQCPDKESLLTLVPQLTDGGVIVGPVQETLIKIRKVTGSSQPEIQEFPGSTFVPLIGEGV